MSDEAEGYITMLSRYSATGTALPLGRTVVSDRFATELLTAVDKYARKLPNSLDHSSSHVSLARVSPRSLSFSLHAQIKTVSRTERKPRVPIVFWLWAIAHLRATRAPAKTNWREFLPLSRSPCILFPHMYTHSRPCRSEIHARARSLSGHPRPLTDARHTHAPHKTGTRWSK